MRGIAIRNVYLFFESSPRRERTHVTIAAFKSLAIALLMFAVSKVVAVEPQKHLVTIDDLRGWKYLAQIQLSPNGKLLAYSFNEKLPEIWLVATELGSVPRKIAQGTFPIWSPDGKQLAFYSRASGTFQLWIFHTESGGVQQVTHLIGGIRPDPQTAASWGYDPLRYGWSPDSTKVVFPSQIAVHTAEGLARSNGIPHAKVNEMGPLILTAQTPPDWTLAGLFRVEGFGKLRGVDGKGAHLV